MIALNKESRSQVAALKSPRRSKAPSIQSEPVSAVVNLVEQPAVLRPEAKVSITQTVREHVPYDGDTAKDLYFQEIGKEKLLTIQDEIDLAALIKQGDESARQRMIRANLRLVVKIAREYENYGLPLLDLINEGNIGLMKAVERFDPAKGGKLSTYSSWWIKQSVRRALANQSKTIRLPIHMVDKIARMRRISLMLTEALGREPTEEELSEEIGVSRHKISMLRQASFRPTSLDAPVNDGEATAYGDIIADDSASDPFTQLESSNLHGELSGLLDILDEREKRIINDRFGLSGLRPMLLEEVGREFGVSRERIRQIQNVALTKMRNALRKKDSPLPDTAKASAALRPVKS